MTSIPLHQLPDEAFQRVLRSMEIYDQLAYSLCSKNTKNSIKSLSLKAYQFKLSFHNEIILKIYLEDSIQFLSSINYDKNFASNQIIAYEYIKMKVHVPKPIGTSIEWTWNFENFELREWVHHFCEVLHHPKIDYLFFYAVNMNDSYIEPIQKVIKGLQIGCIGICRRVTTDFAKKALENFSIYEKLFLHRIPFGRDKLNKLLVQNLKTLCIPNAEEIEIDQVLLMNSKRIQLSVSTFTEKDFNRLLRLWIRGSNPNLNFFFTRRQHGRGSFDTNVIMEGIKYKQIPLDSDEMYRDYINENYYNKIKLARGYRLRRSDGKTAVIVVTEREFQFIVE